MKDSPTSKIRVCMSNVTDLAMEEGPIGLRMNLPMVKVRRTWD